MDLLKRVLRFPLEKEEVKILFRQYGHDNHGNMPYELFCRRLFAGASKVLSMQGVQKAAYDPDDKKQWKFNGMIKYPFCKSTVRCPTAPQPINPDRLPHAHSTAPRPLCSAGVPAVGLGLGHGRPAVA